MDSMITYINEEARDMDLSPLKPQELAKKDELTFDEALVLMRHFDARIKEIAKNRLPVPKAETGPLVSGAYMGIPGVLVSALSILPTICMNVADFGEPEAIASAALTVSGAASLGFALHVESYKNATDGIFFRKTRRKNLTKREEELEAATRLYKMKEKEYQKALKKMAKPAYKALTVINSHLEDEVVVYNDEQGSEGFTRAPRFVPAKDDWEELAVKTPASKAFGKRREAEVKGLWKLDSPKKIKLARGSQETKAISA